MRPFVSLVVFGAAAAGMAAGLGVALASVEGQAPPAREADATSG